MAETNPDNDKKNPDQGVSQSPVTANIGELTADHTPSEDGYAKTTDQYANHFTWQPLIRILELPGKWWESLKDPSASNRTIAVATVFIAIATGFTWLEVHQGSKQTDRIVNASESIQLAIRRGNRQNRAAFESMLEQSEKAMNETVGAMGESSKISRETLTSVQRAFITWIAVRDERSETPSGEVIWVMRPTIQNSGVTPAVSAINYAYEDGLPGEPDEARFKGNKPRSASITIGPQAIQDASFASKPESFIFGTNIPANLATPPKPIPNLYLWGWIAYRDVFPGTKTHITEYCLHLEDVRLSPLRALLWDWGHCQTHNCTDEYCKDYANIAAELPN